MRRVSSRVHDSVVGRVLRVDGPFDLCHRSRVYERTPHPLVETAIALYYLYNCVRETASS
jgi:hypothetical protein